jgi:hypothetical protein
VWTNLISNGLLVTTPSPLGKKSKPTTASKRELLPLDYDPKTAILGKLICSKNQKIKVDNGYNINIIFNLIFYKMIINTL